MSYESTGEGAVMMEIMRPLYLADPPRWLTVVKFVSLREVAAVLLYCYFWPLV
jgi:hypothetical protein